jgi:aminoglycoside phosphotransferase (APT) family kinase protein
MTDGATPSTEVTTGAASPIRRSSRDPEVLRERLEQWLRSRLGAGSDAVVSDVGGTAANGMSSDTVLFHARWHDGDHVRDENLVARVAPDPGDVPVFPTYDMRGQYDVLRLVAERSGAPVPRTLWCEEDTAALGAPFFVMARVDGVIPPDVLPYPFGGNWLYDADPHDQKRLQDSTVEAIAALHAIDDAPARFPWLERAEAGDSRLRRHVAHTRAWYDVVAREGARSPLVERAFAWLDKHWPHHESEPVLCWGDARIGNVIYQGFSPAAVLDWEMAAICPRELDLGWFVFLHRFFQDIAEFFEVPGLPDFLRRSDVERCYQDLTGHAPRHMDFYLTYAAIRHAIVMARIKRRMIHFGEDEVPGDPDDYVLHRASLDKMLAGTYGWD